MSMFFSHFFWCSVGIDVQQRLWNCCWKPISHSLLLLYLRPHQSHRDILYGSTTSSMILHKYTWYLTLFPLAPPPSLVLSHISFASLSPPSFCPSHVPHSIFLLCKFYCYISKGHPFVCMPACVLGSLYSRLQCSCLLFVLPDLPTLCIHKSMVYVSFFFSLSEFITVILFWCIIFGCLCKMSTCQYAGGLVPTASFCLDWSFGIIAKGKKKKKWSGPLV